MFTEVFLNYNCMSLPHFYTEMNFQLIRKKRYEIRTICLYNLYTITKATFISVFNKFYSHHSLYLHSLSFHLMQKRSK